MEKAAFSGGFAINIHRDKQSLFFLIATKNTSADVPVTNDFVTAVGVWKSLRYEGEKSKGISNSKLSTKPSVPC